MSLRAGLQQRLVPSSFVDHHEFVRCCAAEELPARGREGAELRVPQD
jgi:hypothetical protein